MECRTLHGFGAPASPEGEGLWSFWGLHVPELLVEFEVCLASSKGGVANLVVPGSSWGWVWMGIMLCQGLWFLGILGMIAGTFPWAGGGSEIVWSLVFYVEFWPHTKDKEKTNKFNYDDMPILL